MGVVRTNVVEAADLYTKGWFRNHRRWWQMNRTVRIIQDHEMNYALSDFVAELARRGIVAYTDGSPHD